MSRELAIQENVPCNNTSGTRRVWALSIVALLLLGLLVWKFLPRKPTERPFELRGLKLVDTVVHLPTAAFKRIDFSLPCAGTLSLELTCEGENDIDVFVVSPAELARMNAKQTFAHLDGFDGHLKEKYQHTARLTPGKYCLVLMDKSSGRLGSSRTPIHFRAHLSELN
jgi:hypothetical protein